MTVPIPCELTVLVDSLDHPQGYGRCYESFVLKAGGSPVVTMKIERGQTIRGRVVDSQTDAPIAGAEVMTLRFMPPLFVGDSERQVLTDAQGRFTLRGVDGTLEVRHLDYLSETIYDLNDFIASDGLRLPLSRGPSARGRIVAPTGQPLAHVKVTSSGKHTVTGPDGTFELKGIDNRRSYYSLSVASTGYAEQWLQFDSVEKELLITMTPLFQIRGQVRTASGAPVTAYRVVAGPGENPADFQCEALEVNDTGGKFTVSSDESGRHWVGVRSPGFAPWEGWCDVQSGFAEINASLTPGVSVTGSIRRPESSSGEITLKLIPQRPPGHTYIVSDTAARDIATETTQLRTDGTFEFVSVRPDRYQLIVSGADITPIIRNTIIPMQGLSIGTLPAQGTGIIEGTVYDDGTGLPVPYAEGTWKLVGLDEQVHGEFRAGVDGSYRINNAPIGVLQVYRPEHLTADIIGGEVREALVQIGEVTRVHFADPAKGQDLTIQFLVGDGSNAAVDRGTGAIASRQVRNVTDRDPMYHLRLERLTATASVWPDPDWHSLVDGKIKLTGVSLGHYRLHICDWGGSAGFQEELTSVEFMKSEASSHLVVPLGSGAVSGKITHANESRHYIHVMAVSEARQIIRSTHCDETGAFCLRYVPPGKYRIFAHDELAGWCELTSTSIQENLVELPEFSLTSGAQVEGTLSVADGANIPERIEVIHETGMVLNVGDFVAQDGQRYSIRHLWPGRWTLRLKQGSNTLDEDSVQIHGTESHTVDLNARP